MPTPRPTSTRGFGTGARTCASSAPWSRASSGGAMRSSSCRRSSTSSDPGDLLARFARARARPPTCRPPTGSPLRPRGREKSDNPWHLREYTAAEFRELLAPRFASVEIHGVFHARKLRAARARAASRLGPRAPRTGRDQPLLRLVRARDRRLGFRAPPRARLRPRPRTRLSRRLPLVSKRAPAGDLAIVLHSHMPYVEGFGTYPFGEEWLFDAVIRSYAPPLRGRRRADDDRHPGARRPARGSRRRRPAARVLPPLPDRLLRGRRRGRRAGAQAGLRGRG